MGGWQVGPTRLDSEPEPVTFCRGRGGRAAACGRRSRRLRDSADEQGRSLVLVTVAYVVAVAVAAAWLY